MPAVLVIGSSGHFGGRICRRLARQDGLQLIVSSRDAARADAVASRIDCGRAGATIVPMALDVDSDNFADAISDLSPDVVIHTAGPYQGQDYAVARACIDAGSHYVDLADGRDFVAGIGALDDAAKAANVSIVAGGSTNAGNVERHDRRRS